jgi:hypothetical protein
VKVTHPDARVASAHPASQVSRPGETYGGEWVVVLQDQDGDLFAVELSNTPDNGPPEAADEANKVDGWLNDSGYALHRVDSAHELWFASWGPP